MDNAIIRKAVSGDLNPIGILWQEFMDYHKRCDPHFTRSVNGHEIFKDFISGHMNLDTSCVLVAENSEKIVAYCLATISKHLPVFEDRDYGTILDLAVTEQYRRKSIGYKLYKEVESWFVERGVHRIEIRVVTSNLVSTNFWRKMKFIPYVETAFRNI